MTNTTPDRALLILAFRDAEAKFAELLRHAIENRNRVEATAYRERIATQHKAMAILVIGGPRFCGQTGQPWPYELMPLRRFG